MKSKVSEGTFGDLLTGIGLFCLCVYLTITMREHLCEISLSEN